MIRAAIATKKKYGAVALCDEDREACEKIAGRKWSEMWLGEQPEGVTPHPLEQPVEGKYAILEEEKAALEAEIETARQKATAVNDR